MGPDHIQLHHYGSTSLPMTCLNLICCSFLQDDCIDTHMPNPILRCESRAKLPLGMFKKIIPRVLEDLDDLFLHGR